MSMKELLFVMIKPGGVRRNLVGEIISRFEKKGFELVDMKFLPKPNTELVKCHYEEHASKGFFKDLVDNITEGPVIAIKFSGNVQVARKIVGKTLPWEAEQGTIRGDLACCLRDNLVHCSDSIESSKREIGLWF